MSQPQEPRRILEQPASAWSELVPGMRELRQVGPSAEQLQNMRRVLGLPGTVVPRPRAHGPWRGPWLYVVTGVLLMAAGAAWWRHAQAPQPLAKPAAPRTVVHAQPARANAAEPVAAVVDPAPVVQAPPPAVKAEPRRKPAVSAARSDDHDDIASAAELALLRRAKAHARSEPSRALALVAEHERDHARGALVQEREVIAIEALLVAGQRSLAQQRATRFFARFPDSAHSRRIRTLLVESADDSDKKVTSPSHPSK